MRDFTYCWFVFRAFRINGCLRAKAVVENGYMATGDNPELISPAWNEATLLGYPDKVRWRPFFEDPFPKEPYLAVADYWHARQLLALQPFVIIDIDGVVDEIEPPFFLATEDLGCPTRLRCSINLANDSLDQYPDVLALIEYESHFSRDDPISQLGITNLHEPTNLSLPLATWMPISLETRTTTHPAVYKLITRKTRGADAKADLYIARQNVKISVGDKLIRHVPASERIVYNAWDSSAPGEKFVVGAQESVIGTIVDAFVLDENELARPEDNRV